MATGKGSVMIDGLDKSPRGKIARLRHKTEGEGPDTRTVLSAACYTGKFAECIYRYHQEGMFCDFAIKLDSGTEMKVHKLVLAATSIYFNALFTSEMVEMEQGFVKLSCIKDSAMKEVLRFMYTGKLALCREGIADVLEAASRLQVEQALHLCSAYLEDILSRANCTDVYNLADRYCQTKVKQNTYAFMARRFITITEDQLELLTYEQMKDLVASDCLLNYSEWDVFNKVRSWLKKQSNEKKAQYTVDLMELVRFPLMTANELVNQVSKCDFMVTNRECNALLNEAKDYHLVSWNQASMQNERTKVRHANIIHMAFCEKHAFYIYPMFSTEFKLIDEPIELKKPLRALISPSVCVYNNFLYVCGGIHDSNSPSISTARCFRYDPRTDSWFEIAPMNEARQKFQLEVCGGSMFAFGGEDESGVSRTYEVYSFPDNEWKAYKLPPDFHSAKFCASLSKGDSIYVSGGSIGTFVSSACVQYMNDSKSPGSLICRKLPEMHIGRKRHCMVTHGEKLFVFGGMTSSVEIFDIAIEKWTLHPGFSESLGAVHHVIGCCALDPKRVIIAYQKERQRMASGSYAAMIDLTADPTKEKERFVRKLDGPACHIREKVSSFGLQLQMPVGEVISRRFPGEQLVNLPEMSG